MKIFIALILLAGTVYGLTDIERSRMALQNPDLFQGDILGFDPNDRNIIPYKQMRWPMGVIPYVIDSSLRNHTALIKSAMENYHKYTCIRFVPRTNQTNYLNISSGEGCRSYVGMVNIGAQELSLAKGCLVRGIIIHELGHAVGFYHEQNRSDRDKHLIIFWRNIKKDMYSQFELLKPDQNLLLGEFDYDSIMLYGNYAFSKDGRSITMVAKNGRRLLEPYEKQGLSRNDIYRVRNIYGCSR